MRTIIIDDDTTATICLVEKLKKYNEIEVCGTATTGEIGMKLVREVRPDLLFLDVELPDYSGVEENGSAAVIAELRSTISALNTRLNEPFVTVNTVAGDYGIQKAQDDYDRLMKNKSPKSRK